MQSIINKKGKLASAKAKDIKQQRVQSSTLFNCFKILFF